MIMESVGYLSVGIGAIVGFFIGALWYSPFLFGNTWMREVRITKKQIRDVKEKGMTLHLLINFIATLLMSFTLAYLGIILEITTVFDALFLGFVVWLGFVATTMLNSVIFEGRSVLFYIINSGYQLVMLLVMSIIHLLL